MLYFVKLVRGHHDSNRPERAGDNIYYLGFLFTCAHAFVFQVLESREILWIVVVLLVTVLVLIGQGYGFATVKRSPTGQLRKAVHTDVNI